jgi:3-dehydroquinate dehydratase I
MIPSLPAMSKVEELTEKFAAIDSGKVCISVYGRTVAELVKNRAAALTLHAGFVELRLDYLRSPLQEISKLKLSGLGSRDLLTFRSGKEGGVARVAEETRRRVLLEIVSKSSPALVDLEIDTLDTFPEVFDALRKKNKSSARIGLIASSHNFEKTEDPEELQSLIVKAVKRYSPAIVKVVRRANHFDDNHRMLSLYPRLLQRIRPTRLVAFCIGPLGVFSRIACVSYGSPFTFASLPGRRTAPGQLDALSMKVLLDSWGTKGK